MLEYWRVCGGPPKGAPKTTPKNPEDTESEDDSRQQTVAAGEFCDGLLHLGGPHCMNSCVNPQCPLRFTPKEDDTDMMYHCLKCGRNVCFPCGHDYSFCRRVLKLPTLTPSADGGSAGLRAERPPEPCSEPHAKRSKTSSAEQPSEPKAPDTRSWKQKRLDGAVNGARTRLNAAYKEVDAAKKNLQNAIDAADEERDPTAFRIRKTAETKAKKEANAAAKAAKAAAAGKQDV